MKKKTKILLNERSLKLLSDRKQSWHQIHICSNIMIRGKNSFYLWIDEVKMSPRFFFFIYNITLLALECFSCTQNWSKKNFHVQFEWMNCAKWIFSSIYEIKSHEKSFTPSGFFLSFNLAQFFSFVDSLRQRKVEKKEKTKSNQNQNAKHTKFLLNAPLCTENKKTLKPRE